MSWKKKDRESFPDRKKRRTFWNAFFDDHYDSNMWAIRNTPGSRTIFLQGEKHLMELDCPERVVDAAFDFFDECEKGYYKELIG